MTTTKNLPEDDIMFLLDLANGNDQNDTVDFNRLAQIRSALIDTDLPEGVKVTDPEGKAFLLSARDLDGCERPIRIFFEEWQIDLIISIGGEADPYTSGPKLIKTELPTGLSVQVVS
jgi:hypothetical protein